MKTFAIIDCGKSPWESCDDTDADIRQVLEERDRLTEDHGHDQARLFGRGYSSEEVFDILTDN
jgi:hypothetical protein